MQYKKILLIGIILLATLIGVFFLASLKQPATITPKPTPVITTPTPIPLPPTAFRDLTISSVSPSDGSVDAGLTTTITATFSRPLTDAEKQYVSFSVNPAVEGSLSWSTNNDTAVFTPFILALNTPYQVVLHFGTTTTQWTFTTVNENTLTQEDKNALQGQSDNQFGQWQNQLYANYPWYDNFPLQTTDYFTYFDIDTKSFVSDLYTSESNTQKINTLKQTIIKKVQSFGINVNNYRLVWNINPVSE